MIACKHKVMALCIDCHEKLHFVYCAQFNDFFHSLQQTLYDILYVARRESADIKLPNKN